MRDGFLMDETTSDGGSAIAPVAVVYETVISFSFLNLIRISTCCLVRANTGIAKLGCLKK